MRIEDDSKNKYSFLIKTKTNNVLVHLNTFWLLYPVCGTQPQAHMCKTHSDWRCLKLAPEYIISFFWKGKVIYENIWALLNVSQTGEHHAFVEDYFQQRINTHRLG